MPRLLPLFLMLTVLIAATPVCAQPRIVAAENFYADIARQLAGPDATITAILSNPDQDPHLFEASPSVGRAISAADIAIMSGIGYDPWMGSLIGAARNTAREVIVVADLVGRKDGDNPHIWYNPATMRALAMRLADTLARLDGAHAGRYRQRLAAFQAAMAPLDTRISLLHARLAGLPATATEPVFGEMFAALGMKVRNARFQLAVMNGTEPSASDIAAFEQDLKSRAVRVLVYNSQVSDPIAVRMEGLARASHVPVLGVTETMPAGKTYQGWMIDTLDALDRAVAE